MAGLDAFAERERGRGRRDHRVFRLRCLSGFFLQADNILPQDFDEFTVDKASLGKFPLLGPRRYLEVVCFFASRPSLFDGLRRLRDCPRPHSPDLALHQAAFAGFDEGIKHLVDFGADPLKLVSGLSMLSRALEESSMATANTIAVICTEAPKLISLPSASGNLPLHQAIVWRAPVEYLKTLIEFGADPGSKTRDGKTAVELAKDVKNVEAIDLLNG